MIKWDPSSKWFISHVELCATELYIRQRTGLKYGCYLLPTYQLGCTSQHVPKFGWFHRIYKSNVSKPNHKPKTLDRLRNTTCSISAKKIVSHWLYDAVYHLIIWRWYPLVIWHSYWKWPFIVDLSIENDDFP